MSDISAQVEQEIIKLSHEWIEAIGRRDGGALDHILSDDFLIAGWQPEGKLGDKQFYMRDALLPVDATQSTFAYDQWTFRVYENIVIANSIFSCKVLISGEEWGGKFLFTDVWIKNGGGWQVVSRHSSPVIEAQTEIKNGN
jgi:hypothetical protein